MLTLEQQYLSDPRKRLGRGDRDKAAKKLYEFSNLNVVDYKGLVGAVTPGATTTMKDPNWLEGG